MKQLVDSQKLQDAALKISSTNNALRLQINQLRKRASRLEGSWRSSAGDSAALAMRELLDNDEARFSILERYIKFLSEVVTPNAVNAEDTNIKLSDLFK